MPVNVTDLYICNLDAVCPIHVIANNVAIDHFQKLTHKNGRMFIN